VYLDHIFVLLTSINNYQLRVFFLVSRELKRKSSILNLNKRYHKENLSRNILYFRLYNAFDDKTMNVLTWSCLFAIFVVGNIIVMCVHYSLKMTSSGKKDIYLNTVKKRTQHIKDICFNYEGLTHRGRFKPNYFMIVDDKHKLLYCMIPKVACTTFKMVIAKSLTAGNVSEQKIHFSWYIHSLGLNYQYKYSKKEIELRLKTYFKFVVVRHPFDRLLSAYADKFLDPERNMMTFPRLKNELSCDLDSFPTLTRKDGL